MEGARLNSVNNKKIIFPPRLFISGTDTGIGKTMVSAILMSGPGTRYWKPIQSGLADQTDTQWIMEKTGLNKFCFFPETYRLSLPLSPHASAAADGTFIDLKAFEMPETKDEEHLIIEGAGGLLVPLNDKEMMTDLIIKLDVPVLLVARSALGTINHTLLSFNIMRQKKIEIFGVVMNGPRNSINREAIEHFGQTSVIAEIENIREINPENLKKCFEKEFCEYHEQI
jgi:dethiobiotin synthase